jgi:hypothetical protein
MKINNMYFIKFAGEKILCKLYNIEENDGELLYWFTDNKYKYPIRKENICGNFKQ